MMEVSEEASRGTVIRALPLPTGRLERDLEVLLEGSRTAAITVWFSRARYLDRSPLPIPICRGFVTLPTTFEELGENSKTYLGWHQ